MPGIVRKAYRRLVQGLPDDPPTRKDIDLPRPEGRRKDPRLVTRFDRMKEGFRTLQDKGIVSKRLFGGSRSPGKR